MHHPVRESFAPRWYSIFFNPFYLNRAKLYRGIKRHAHHMQGTLLDFGCGTKPYKNIMPAAEYVGLDYATEVSRRNPLLAADVFYDGKTIPFADHTFDSVFSSEVLEHVFNPDEILAEINRVMKPGAYMLLTCPFFWPEHEQPYDFARYSSFALKHLMEKHGFEVIQFEKTGSYVEAMAQGIALYHYYFIPHKPKFLAVIFHTLFVTPVMLTGLLLSKILPKRIKRSDFYMTNIILVRKK
jgi:SAM-dependent methyltransferase